MVLLIHVVKHRFRVCLQLVLLSNYQILTLLQSTADNVALFLEDVKQDGDIVTQFNIPEAGAISRIEMLTEIRESFHSRHSV